ncbi:MAG: hypothetical protein WC749_02265 [Dehalococcoidia bacterium]
MFSRIIGREIARALCKQPDDYASRTLRYAELCHKSGFAEFVEPRKKKDPYYEKCLAVGNGILSKR